MLSKEDIDAIARGFNIAEKQRRLVRPPGALHSTFTVEDAYAVQRSWQAIKQSEGNTVKGHKIGLASRPMQRQAGIEEPDYGVLFADMFYDNGAEIPINRFIQPRLEVELGFVIGKRLQGPSCTIFDVLNATDYVVPSAEIIDSRSYRVDAETGKSRTVLDSIADNAGNAALVVGGRPVRPDELDLRWVAALCHRNNVIEESGVAAAVLNHPANGIAWLANRLAQFDTALEPGEFVLSGSFVAAVEVRAGDTFHLDYGLLGSISCRFV